MNMIEMRDVKKYFYKKDIFCMGKKEPVKAVDDVSFTVQKGKTFGLVGESGCGKSTIAKMIVGMLVPSAGRVTVIGDKDIVFQDPYGSLNPRMTISQIIAEPLVARSVKKDKIERSIKEILARVRLDYGICKDKYPHQFSGGQRQRIAIARVLIHKPDVIVLDEPVSSLDVSIQAGILNLLKDLQEEFNLTYLFISHDLRVVEFMSDVVGVMKNGKFVEVAPSDELYRSPKSDYTKMLLAVVPDFSEMVK
ncbi:MAG: ATP-binding cassette domain-containing protein [Candidatus Omnitrophota bacterium]|nr:ATP-binding cassette domain-containing protein [Candidatus Omnitrophota bacterium]